MINVHTRHEDPDERLQLLRFLLTDRDWRCEPPVRRLLQGLLEEPPVSQESSWHLLAEEITAYLAFRKQVKAAARACHGQRSPLRANCDDREAAPDRSVEDTRQIEPARWHGTPPVRHRTAA